MSGVPFETWSKQTKDTQEIPAFKKMVIASYYKVFLLLPDPPRCRVHDLPYIHYAVQLFPWNESP
jgi:hypothetical protein